MEYKLERFEKGRWFGLTVSVSVTDDDIIRLAESETKFQSLYDRPYIERTGIFSGDVKLGMNVTMLRERPQRMYFRSYDDRLMAEKAIERGFAELEAGMNGFYRYYRGADGVFRNSHGMELTSKRPLLPDAIKTPTTPTEPEPEPEPATLAPAPPPLSEPTEIDELFALVKQYERSFRPVKDQLIAQIAREVAHKFPKNVAAILEPHLVKIIADEVLFRELPTRVLDPLPERDRHTWRRLRIEPAYLYDGYPVYVPDASKLKGPALSAHVAHYRIRNPGREPDAVRVWRSFLREKRYFFEHPDEIVASTRTGLTEALFPFHSLMPLGSSPFETILGDATPIGHSALGSAKEMLRLEACKGHYTLATLYTKLLANLESDYTINLNAQHNTEAQYRRTFGGTGLLPIYLAPVQIDVPMRAWLNHTWIMGGSGSGKTSLIEKIVLHHAKAPEKPAMVIVDPHSDLIARLTRADIGIEDRIVWLNPRDISYPVALNPFALNKNRMRSYDEGAREQVASGAIQTFLYLFSGLADLSLTGKQETFFQYCMRLMLAVPETMGRNATILDLLRLMEAPSEYAPAIKALRPEQREFFERDFASKTFGETKDQIRYRLQSILSNPTLARLFTANETKVDLFEEMNRGSIILVDTSKEFLKDGSALFGRLVISLVYQAVMERASIPEHARKPALLVVDEAASYFDKSIDDLLTDARKFKVGCIFAHQHIEQASYELRHSLEKNTGIQILADPNVELRFTLHIPRVSAWKVPLAVKPGLLANMPKLSEERYQAFVSRNRARVSLGTGAPPPRFVAPRVTQAPKNEW